MISCRCVSFQYVDWELKRIIRRHLLNIMRDLSTWDDQVRRQRNCNLNVRSFNTRVTQSDFDFRTFNLLVLKGIVSAFLIANVIICWDRADYLVNGLKENNCNLTDSGKYIYHIFVSVFHSYLCFNRHNFLRFLFFHRCFAFNRVDFLQSVVVLLADLIDS